MRSASGWMQFSAHGWRRPSNQGLVADEPEGEADVITDAHAPRHRHRREMNLTKCSTTELTPTVEHSGEAPTFTAVDSNSMRNTHESQGTPLTENAASEQARPRQTSRERPVSQPIGPSEPLPQPSSFEAPE